MQTLWQDVRYALRMLAKSPGFAIVAILTLALGIGANTAIFTLIDAVMLRSIPVRDPQRLVSFRWTAHRNPRRNSYSNYGDCGNGIEGAVYGCSFSLPVFKDIRSQTTAFSRLAGFAGPFQFNLSGNGPARMVRGVIVVGDYFSTLGVNAAVGRLLDATDDNPSAAPALVLSYSYWQGYFGGDPSVAGRTIRLNGAPFTIVGVADPNFTSLSPGKTQDLWVPEAQLPPVDMTWLEPESRHDAQTWWVVMVGRLNATASIAQAQAQVNTLFRNAMLHGPQPFSKADDAPAVTLTPILQGLPGQRWQYSKLLYVLMSSVGLVLLIACANIAGLTLARSAARQKEIAVRLALGAGRVRVARQLLTESILLSLAGGAFGVLVAYWAVDAITPLISGRADRPFPFVVAPDWRVLIFTLSAAVLTGVLLGLLPALRSTRVDLTPALKAGVTSAKTRTGRQFRLGDSLVVAQVALSIVVLVGAGLLVRTLQNLHSIDAGFDTRNLLLFGISPSLSGYDDARSRQLYDNLRTRFAAIPGVTSVSYSSNALLSGYMYNTELHIPGQPEKSTIVSDLLYVGPDFFHTMHVPLLAGRTLNRSDFLATAETVATQEAAEKAAKKPASPRNSTSTRASVGAPIPIVINQSFAQKFFGSRNPLGQHLDDTYDDPSSVRSAGYYVVGVTGNTKYSDLKADFEPTFYQAVTGGGAHFELRTAADPTTLVPVVRDIVNHVDANLPLFEINTQTGQIDQQLAQERLVARLSSFFGILALALACIGLYGLLSYEVTRRTREIGIRIALGAQRDHVLHLVVRHGLTLAIAGAAFGLVAAFGVTRYLASLLYGVRPADPLTFATMAFLLFAVAVAACYLPAHRATRVDPLVALRYD